MKPRVSEYAVQLSIRDWLALRRIATVHVPNGMAVAGNARQRSAHIAKMKRAGMLSGFPDLILFPPHLATVGFVEIKTPTGTVSKEQRECIAWLTSLGHRVAVVRSIDDMADALHEWGWSDGCVSIGAASLRVADRLRGALA